MKYLKDICVIIQARLGSQRIPQKMIKPFADTTLFDLSIQKVLDSDFIPKDNFYVSIYEQELINIAQKREASIFLRSEKSANSEGTPMTEMYEWWDKLPFKYCVLVNGCTPFLETKTIDKNGKLQTPWPEEQACMNTKAVEPTYEAAHCLYAGRLDLIKEGVWMGDFQKPGDIELHAMAERECLDIDYPWQFELCETLYLESLRKET